MTVQEILLQLNKEKDIITKEILTKEKELQEINITIANLTKIINEIEVICSKCNGKGKIFKRACAEDDGDYYMCNNCEGKGRIKL